MGEVFDPYHKWFGIHKEEQPPDHYRLLGISPFEADPLVIESAAERQILFLRSLQHGPNAHHSQKLLNEVSQARICLLNSDSKHTYDQQLRSTRSEQGSSKPSTVPNATRVTAKPAAAAVRAVASSPPKIAAVSTADANPVPDPVAPPPIADALNQITQDELIDTSKIRRRSWLQRNAKSLVIGIALIGGTVAVAIAVRNELSEDSMAGPSQTGASGSRSDSETDNGVKQPWQYRPKRAERSHATSDNTSGLGSPVGRLAADAAAGQT